jgi:hypothetical protein
MAKYDIADDTDKWFESPTDEERATTTTDEPRTDETTSGAMHTSLPPGSDGPAARQLAAHESLLAETDARRAELQQRIDDTVESEEALPLIRELRVALDELDWMRQALPKLQRAAVSEAHHALQAELNSEWPPLAAERIDAVKNLESCTNQLLAALEALQDIHGRQHAVVARALELDRLIPGGMAAPAWQLLTALSADYDLELAWVRGRLGKGLPDGGRSMSAGDEMQIDQTSLAYRGRVF